HQRGPRAGRARAHGRHRRRGGHRHLARRSGAARRRWRPRHRPPRRGRPGGGRPGRHAGRRPRPRPALDAHRPPPDAPAGRGGRPVTGGAAVRRWVLPVVAVALVLAVALVDGTQAAGRSVAPRPVDRVLIVSPPGGGWADVEAHDLPNLEALAAEAAVGQLATRVGRRGASLTDAYLSLGAGTRALAPSLDPAVALDPEESYGGIRTTDILLRRIGRVPDGIAYL